MQSCGGTDTVHDWMQKNWATFREQLSARGWTLTKPRFAVQPHRAVWQFPPRLHEG